MKSKETVTLSQLNHWIDLNEFWCSEGLDIIEGYMPVFVVTNCHEHANRQNPIKIKELKVLNKLPRNFADGCVKSILLLCFIAHY